MGEARKHALVFGAAGSLGGAVAEAFVREGYVVSAFDRDRTLLGRRLGGETGVLSFHGCDLRDARDTASAIKGVIASAGAPDSVCHATGGFEMGEAVHEISTDGWMRMMAINAESFLNVAKSVIPPMRAAGGGSVVAVGAMGAQGGAPGMGAYAASKRALQALVEAMADEQRDRGIRVNAVLPSIIDTPANRASMPDADCSRWVSPRDLASVVLFLASNAARAVNGAAIPVRHLA
ncbi:SDR family oxidoreductase [Pigmentiphaga sp. H8]|uniref:SDR family oxidoreductase n=1 Tax=Pigmentiphaga sp. H8 TaxID=2488560 RepID=UPI000F597EBF|nr:SDR family oxidoreductase [Pigmentiphaga sp. H8]AZG08253.1 SDR family oxidoreductase [Pigmentiphaga sp. H8]